MDKYKITFETWNKVASIYQDRFMDLELYNDTFDLFCELIDKKNPAILEIGCGPGNITRYISSVRPDFKISAIDVSPNMIDRAQKNNPAVDCTIMDCRDINTITGKFDGIICGFCIPYLSMDDSAKLLKDSFHLLNATGILYFSTIQGDYDHSGFEVASTGDSAYVYYYSEAHFRKELIKNGFELIHLIQKDFPKSNGRIENTQIFIARKS